VRSCLWVGLLIACGGRTDLDRDSDDARACEWRFGSPVRVVEGVGRAHATAVAVQIGADLAFVQWRDEDGSVGGAMEVVLDEPPYVIGERPASPVDYPILFGALGGWIEVRNRERTVVRWADGDTIAELDGAFASVTETRESVDVVYDSGDGLEVVSVLRDGSLERASYGRWLTNARALRIGEREWVALSTPRGLLAASTLVGDSATPLTDLRLPTRELAAAWSGDGDIVMLVEGGGDTALQLLDPITLDLRFAEPAIPIAEAGPYIVFAARTATLVVSEYPSRIYVVEDSNTMQLECPDVFANCGRIYGNPGSDLAVVVGRGPEEASVWLAPLRCE
jgi:hypothetical protein